MEIKFNEEKHIYTVGGKVIPSVTTILKSVINKPGLLYWTVNMITKYIEENIMSWNGDIEDLMKNAKKVPNEVRDEASNRGKVAHTWFEHGVKKTRTKKDYNKKYKGYIDAVDNFMKVCSNNGIVFLDSEMMLYNKLRGLGAYCGTLDGLAEDKDGFIIIDLKT